MEHIRVPSKIKRNNRVYIYKEQINDKVYLYEEEKTKYKECFLLQDLVQLKEQIEPIKKHEGGSNWRS